MTMSDLANLRTPSCNNKNILFTQSATTSEWNEILGWKKNHDFKPWSNNATFNLVFYHYGGLRFTQNCQN